MTRGVVAAMVVTVLLFSGCTKPDGAPVQIVPGTEPTRAPATSSASARDAVRVEVSLKVGASRETKALTAYLRARTESFLRGSITPRLRAHATRSEFRRQRGLVRSAVEGGFTVPARPRAAVIGRQRPAPKTTVLDVCFYLPSTEYLDQTTGKSPYGEVPRRWQPATVRMVKSPVTWKVAKVVPPPKQGGPTCRGLD